jgi:hypothetical protein
LSLRQLDNTNMGEESNASTFATCRAGIAPGMREYKFVLRFFEVMLGAD